MQCDANGWPFQKCIGDRSVELLISPKNSQQIRSIFTFRSGKSLEWMDCMETRTQQRTLKIEEGRTGRTCRLRTCREGIRCDDAVDIYYCFRWHCWVENASFVFTSHNSHTAHDTSHANFEEIGSRPSRNFNMRFEPPSALHLIWFEVFCS